MIYTVGKKEIYNQVLKENPEIKKLKGGSVWRSHRKALKYLHDNLLHEIGEWEIYGINEEWRNTINERGAEWRKLDKDCRIIKLYFSKGDGKRHSDDFHPASRPKNVLDQIACQLKKRVNK